MPANANARMLTVGSERHRQEYRVHEGGIDEHRLKRENCRNPDKHELIAEHADLHDRIAQRAASHAACPERADEGRRLPMTMRERCDTALTVRRTAIEPRHLGRGSRLVDEHQPMNVDLRLRCFPRRAFSGHVRPIPLAGVRCFF